MTELNEFTVVDVARPGDVIILGLSVKVGHDELYEIVERLQSVCDKRNVDFVVFEQGIELIRIERKTTDE